MRRGSNKSFQVNPQPFAFASLMRAAAGPDNPSVLFSREFAIQPTGINKWRILMGEPEIGNIRANLKSLKGDPGFRFKNNSWAYFFGPEKKFIVFFFGPLEKKYYEFFFEIFSKKPFFLF